MANPYFQFKQFTVYHDRCAMKVTTDSCLFGAWVAEDLSQRTEQSKELAGSTLLDIGTGTGLLSLMVAQKVPLRIEAIEIDSSAADQAADNVAASPFRERITVIQTGVQDLRDKSYEVLLSNPPFYENELKSGIKAKDVAHHAHQLTWAELFASINRLMKPDGVFYLLLPYKRSGELKGYLEREKLFVNKLISVSQSTAHSPFRIMVQGSRYESKVIEEQLAIKDADQQYTPAFTALLKPYYLYL